MTTHTLVFQPRGPFSLEPLRTMACGFLLGTRTCDSDGGVRLAFPADGTFALSGAVIRQRGRDIVAEVTGNPEVLRRQLARLIGLDKDGAAFAQVLAADPVLAKLAAKRPGFRPVVAYSPYVMAGWCVLSQRMGMAQAAKLQQHMAESCGDVVRVAGERIASFPRPQSLLSLTGVPGLPSEKLKSCRSIDSPNITQIEITDEFAPPTHFEAD